MDHNSNDRTLEIAARYDASLEKENTGLGFARQRCLDLADTKYIVFVDSDVEIVDQDFLRHAKRALDRRENGAVVGVAVGHRFFFGLPASLLVLRKEDFQGQIIPKYIDARETFFLQKRLDLLNLKTVYARNAMRHNSLYRKFKPEWEGANTRILPSPAINEIGFTAKVILLLTLNSRSVKNLFYLPIFYLKFLRGFFNPGPWLRLRRQEGEEIEVNQ